MSSELEDSELGLGSSTNAQNHTELLLEALGAALGFEKSFPFAAYDAYLKRHPLEEEDGELNNNQLIWLFVKVVTDFKAMTNLTIQAYLIRLANSEMFSNIIKCETGLQERQRLAARYLFKILGLYTFLQEPFAIYGKRYYTSLATSSGTTAASRTPEASLGSQPLPSEFTIAQLIHRSQIVPSYNDFMDGDLRLLPSLPTGPNSSLGHFTDLTNVLRVEPKDLNFYTLAKEANIRIRWTDDISHHLLVVVSGGRRYVGVFAMPSAIIGDAGKTLSTISGVSTEMMKEIENSYATLFHYGSLDSQPKCRVFRTEFLGSKKVCLCQRCSFDRFKKEITDELEPSPQPNKEEKVKEGAPRKTAVVRDPALRDLIDQSEKPPVTLDRAHFPYLWPRIVALETLRNDTGPWNLGTLFTNTRNRWQHWAAWTSLVNATFGLMNVATSTTSLAYKIKEGGHA